jgi:hypothetical protein
MRTATATLIAALLLGACAIGDPLVVPTAVGRPSHEVTRLVAGTESRMFPCWIESVSGTDGKTVELGPRRPEVTLPPGSYQVKLYCTNNAGHVWHPEAQVNARAGKRYQVNGYFIDDSITIWGMKMRVRVTEL